jgi:hypothetical protein
MVLKSIAILLVGAALGTGLERARAPNAALVSIDSSVPASSPGLLLEPRVVVTASAESADARPSLEPAIESCAGGADATGNDCR